MYYLSKCRTRHAYLFISLFFFLTSSFVVAQSTDGKTNQLIIKYAQPTVQMDVFTAQSVIAQRERSIRSLASSSGITPHFKRAAANGTEIYDLGEYVDVSEVISLADELSQDPSVEYAEPDLILHTMLTPDDSRYNEQWHYYEPTGGLNLPTVWDTTTGSGVVVAVIDTGYLPHQDLLANIVGGYDMISSRSVANDGDGRDSDATDPGDSRGGGGSFHGTHVAGTVAAITNNGIGVAGVAFSAKVLPVRVLGVGGGSTSDIADGIIWASGGSVPGLPINPNPAQVINMSLGGGGACGFTSQNAINIARANGATVVVAAGNSSANARGFTPASCDGVIAVAATNRTGSRAGYSNFGAIVDVAAPGGETRFGQSGGVLSTLNNNGYAFYQGTSMAAPHVAGLAALLYEAKPDITPDEVESVIKDTARAFPGTCSQCGSGIADAAAAVAAVSGVTPPPPPPPPPADNSLENGVAVTGLSGSRNSERRFTMTVPAGATDLSFRMSGGTGDADLYVKFGSQPTTTSFDCRPFSAGNNEVCTISDVQAGSYHVMIRAYNSFSAVSLVGRYTEGDSGGNDEPIVLEENNLSGSSGRWTFFSMDIPEGYTSFKAEISSGTGDADLYIRPGIKPTTRTYTCRAYDAGNTGSCSVQNPTATTWHIGIRAYRSYAGVTLKVVATP